MQLFPVLMVLGLFPVPKINGDLAHYAVYKSFQNAFHECAEYLEVSNCTLQRINGNSYPNTEQVQRLIHCTLVNVGAWNSDQVAVKSHVLQNFFRPVSGDVCHQNRTQQCLKHINRDPEDHFGRAFESFQCFYHQYGNIVSSAQYIPFEINEIYRLVETAIAIHNIPRRALEEYSKGNILEEPHFRALHLTGALFGGYYSFKDGLKLDNAYSQFGTPELLTAETRQCCDAAAREECGADHATKLYRIFKNCLEDIVPTLKLVRTVAEKIVFNLS
uniref:General odorant-binding protein 69 n=1 Tax=Culex pipiens TaxID=7175 RepID=A0A8D8K842_CULPI